MALKKISETNSSVDIAAPPDVCYDVICDIDHYIPWFRHIRTMDVRARYDDGRPGRVHFIFDLLLKKGIQIILNYEYDDDARKLIYYSVGGDIPNAKGYYLYEGLPNGNTRFTFNVRVDFGMLVPETIVGFLTSKVMVDFQDMVRAECERRFAMTK